ncbi:MAG: hypothetical protein R3F43_13930 [bacterium]
MRWVAVALALAGCADFEPVILDYRQALPALSELGGVVARDTGLVVAGTTAGAERSSFAVATLGDAVGWAAARGRGLAEAPVSGLVALPDGGLGLRARRRGGRGRAGGGRRGASPRAPWARGSSRGPGSSMRPVGWWWSARRTWVMAPATRRSGPGSSA